MQRYALILMLLAGCQCNDVGLRGADKMTITFVTPQNEQSFAAFETVQVEIKATNPAGIAELTLWAGAQQLTTCPATGSSVKELSCKISFVPADVAEEIVFDKLDLKATGSSKLHRTAEEKIRIRIKPATTLITIDAPSPTLVAQGSEMVRFHATARNPSGLRSLALSAGTDAIAECQANAGNRELECEGVVVPADHIAQIHDGKIVLKAHAIDAHTDEVEVTQDLLIDVDSIGTSLVIDQPLANSVVNVDSWVRFHATARNLGGVKSITLWAGTDRAGGCTATQADMQVLECEAMFAPREHFNQIVTNTLHLSARAVDHNDAEVEATRDLGIDPASLAILVTIEAPVAGTGLSHRTPVTFQAKAEAGQGLTDLILYAGTMELGRCAPTLTDQLIECAATLRTTDVWSQIASGQLTLTATAHDHDGNPGSDSETYAVEGLSVAFVLPALSQTNPPQAQVHGSGTMELSTSGSAPVTSIDVTLANGTSVRSFTAAPYRATINWTNLLSTGPQTLKATAHDAAGGVATATLDLVVGCSSDSECRTGERCCLESGSCNPIVALGQDCDCTHPCATNQGCFPGTCGQAPRKCRPGCFPGSNSTRADRCGDEDGSPAYCASLPPAEQTTANEGGACAPADSCDVYQQNCPDLPRDRSQPLSATNPAVAYMCIPVSPTRNGCFPAGGRAVGQTCDGPWICSGNVAGGACVEGALCVQSYIGSIPTGAPTCRKMCNPAITLTCSGGQICSGNLSGPGHEPFPQGTCQ